MVHEMWIPYSLLMINANFVWFYSLSHSLLFPSFVSHCIGTNSSSFVSPQQVPHIFIRMFYANRDILEPLQHYQTVIRQTIWKQKKTSNEEEKKTKTTKNKYVNHAECWIRQAISV